MFSIAVSVGIRLNAWNTKPTRSRRKAVSGAVIEAAELGVAEVDLAGRQRVKAGKAVHQRRLA